LPSGYALITDIPNVAGSNGYIQFNSSEDLGADSNLFWDNTNKRLGIGTTNPETRLYIQDSGMFAGFYVENDSISGSRPQRRLGIGVGGPDSPVANWVNSGYLESQALGGMMLGSFHNDMRFGAGGGRATQMILKTNGNVGIGTTSPSEKLDVNGNATISGTISASNLNISN
jgi:hypothetical protein